MNDATNTASDDIQAEEEILTCTVSDEALEAAAGTEKGKSPHQPGANSFSGTWPAGLIAAEFFAACC